MADQVEEPQMWDGQEVVSESHVTVTTEEYANLMLGARLLGALQACGVDNWDGFDDAIDMLNKGIDGVQS